MNKTFLIGACIAALCCVSVADAQSARKAAEDARRAATQSQLKKAGNATPVAVKDGVAKLSQENTKIEFIGVHVGAKPDPRLGGFSKFDGEVKISDDGVSISSVKLEFDMNSLWTQMPKLTSHLKNADFFEVEKYPTSSFESTSISPGKTKGAVVVAGKLTLHGQSKEIKFPATVNVTSQGVTMKSEFKLDRTLFGMNNMTDRVASEVAMTFSVGETSKDGAAAGGRAGGNRGGRGNRGGMDIEKRFKEWDKDGDGKLAGDEIPERMKRGVSRLDEDGDGAITLEEMKARFTRGRGGR